jgi:hypothetical protein
VRLSWEEAMFDLWRLAAISVQVAYNIAPCELPNLGGGRNSERNPGNTKEYGTYKYYYLKLDLMIV